MNKGKGNLAKGNKRKRQGRWKSIGGDKKKENGEKGRKGGGTEGGGREEERRSIADHKETVDRKRR